MQEEKDLTEQVEQTEQVSVRQELLSVTRITNNGYDNYELKMPKGSSYTDAAFCIAAIIKMFARDKIVENRKQMVDAITKCLDDPQFEEVKE